MRVATGHRGATRHLAKVLRNSGCFFMEILVDMESSRHTLFQSKRNTNLSFFAPPRLRAPGSFRRNIDSAESCAGQCSVELSKCHYSSEILVNDIKICIPTAALEEFVMAAYSIA